MINALGSPGLFVLGMHRSGTSATAGALQRLGFALGDRLVAAAADNPKGYFEHAAAVAANESVLNALDRSWDDVRQLPAGWVDGGAVSGLTSKLESVIQEFTADAAWALKDPRLCRTFPLWRKVIGDRGAACLLVLRHPAEVAASLRTRDGIVGEHAALLWLRHVFESESASRGLPRVAITYSDLLADPVACLGSAHAVLGPSRVPARHSDLIDFIDASDRHHVMGGGDDSWGEFSLFAEKVYLTAKQAADPCAAIAQFGSNFDALVRKHDLWVGVLGGTIRAADHRRQAMRGPMLDAQARAEHLQAKFDEVSALSLARMEALHASELLLGRTQAALAAIEASSRQRLGALADLDRRLAETQDALAATEALSLQRLDALADFDRRLGETQAALTAAEALSLQRMAALADYDLRLGQTQDALSKVEALSLDRMEALHASKREQAAIHAEYDAFRAESLRIEEEYGRRLQEAEDMIASLRASRWVRLGRVLGLLRSEGG